MGLFSKSQMDEINSIAQKSKEPLGQVKQTKSVTSFQHEIDQASKAVLEYFRDSEAILITSREQLHEYVLNAIEAGYCGIDTETTGLDRIHDTIVGTCLYYPGGVEAYIPSKHLVPVFDVLYNNQLSYEDVGAELQLFVEAKTKMIFANADFDLAFIYKDLHVDMISICYYDVILAWRCLKEDEQNNGLKPLYCKYVLKGKADAKKFSDFFSPKIFPYCNPEVAKLYAANDAKITYELFMWQLPYVTKSHPKCQKHKLEKIADLIWNIEIPMIRVCALMHRTGVYYDKNTNATLKVKYDKKYKEETIKLSQMIQEVMDNSDSITISKCPFKTGSAFNEASNIHVKYLLNKFLGCDVSSGDKETLTQLNVPITKQILQVRAVGKLLNTFIDKLPNEVAKDGRIHSTFKSIGADCIVGDSIVPTSRGYRLIEELCESYGCKEAEHVDVPDIYICNKDQKLEHAQSVIKYTDYPTIKITTECNYQIEGTYNHPIMVSEYTFKDKIYANNEKLSHFWDNRYFKKLEDIRIGDYVEIPCNYDIGPTEYVSTDFTLKSRYHNSKQIAKFPEVYNEDFAEFLGIYHADGSASLSRKTFSISISNDDPDVISRVDQLALQLFNVSTTRYIDSKRDHEVTTYINSTQIQDLDRILSHGARNKRIPDAIWRSPRSVINNYIKGLTLDSSVYKNGNSLLLVIHITNDLDAKLIHQHLTAQGIYSHWRWDTNKNGYKSQGLVFNADNYLRFCEVIGFVQSCKYIDTTYCTKNGYNSKRIDNSFRFKVKKIEYSTNTVYDLHIPETHSFISNGFISHNTGRMSSASPNVQQIPSHAIDIRHQFRATPMMEKADVCIETDNGIEVTIGLYDTVYMSDNTEKEVIDLQVGDIVKLVNNNEEVDAIVKSISNKAPDACICFDVQ